MRFGVTQRFALRDVTAAAANKVLAKLRSTSMAANGNARVLVVSVEVEADDDKAASVRAIEDIDAALDSAGLTFEHRYTTDVSVTPL